MVRRMDRNRGGFSSYPVGGAQRELSSAEVLSIAEDSSGRLWFATWGAGLRRFDPRNGQWKAYRHKPNDPSSLSRDSVFALLIDRQGRMWAGTEAGRDALDPKTERFQIHQAGGTGP